MASTHIDISIELNARQLDLRVPTAVTLGRLRELVGQVLGDHNVAMPPGWHLELRGKAIALGEFDVIADFPVGNGDVFAVVHPLDAGTGGRR
jgi:uncharacterized ubiquitin-like protein YukD